jgi:hypothetical protein
LDLIYAQSVMLCHLLLDALRSTYDPRQKPGTHADGIVGVANVNFPYSVISQIKVFSLSQSARGPASFVSSNPTQSANVHSVQSLANPNGNQ